LTIKLSAAIHQYFLDRRYHHYQTEQVFQQKLKPVIHFWKINLSKLKHSELQKRTQFWIKQIQCAKIIP